MQLRTKNQNHRLYEHETPQDHRQDSNGELLPPSVPLNRMRSTKKKQGGKKPLESLEEPRSTKETYRWRMKSANDEPSETFQSSSKDEAMRDQRRESSQQGRDGGESHHRSR